MFSAFQTFGKLGAIGKAIAAAWSPLSLWPDGIASPGMWIDPSTLPASFNDYTGTTPVATPGSVADSANPVGLALDIRAGAPGELGPELVVNGDFSNGGTGWSAAAHWIFTNNRAEKTGEIDGYLSQTITGMQVGVGKTYKVTWYQSTSGIFYLRFSGVPAGSGYGSGWKTAFVSPASNDLGFEQGGTAAGDYIDNISVKEVPGNHMLQATSAARPLESARVNLLTYTEDFSNAVWQLLFGLEKTPNYALAPDGTMTACRLYAPTAGGILYGHGVFTTNIVRSVWAKSNTGDSYSVIWGSGGTDVVTPTWQQIGGPASGFLYLWQLVVDEAGGDISVWHPQVELGSADYPYQSVPGDGSTYATDFPIFQKYDGVDDGMATAAFSAGTLLDGMDCMIPVRRDSAAACVAGLYNGVADATKFFGMAESASGSGCVGSGAGTPTVWVDNTQLTGGTAVTRGTLHTALTVGDWHILEFRNLDLSTWTATGFGLYTSYVFPGARGDILLYPSTASTEDKDAARQYLADYYGVTLP